MKTNESIEPIKTNSEIYGSFFLNENEFSVSVKSIQEVVNEPEVYSPVPLSPSYLLGLFNLRGAIVPVIDLTRILKLGEPNGEKHKERKIAIISYNGYKVGLLFDKTGEVFSSQVGELNEFQGNNSEEHHVVKGVFKLDEGKRILQLIDPEAIITLNGVPKTQEIKNSQDEVMRSQAQGQRHQAISFRVGEAFCALDIESIQEILIIKKVDTNALATDKCIGAFNLRGSTVPLIDFGAILGYRDADLGENATSGSRRVIVLKHAEGLFGLLVDSIHNIVTFFENEIVPFPVFGKTKREMFSGCITQGEDIILLDAEHILSNSEIADITKGTKLLYRDGKDKQKQESNKNRGPIKTYISFSLDNNFAVDIKDVREVIHKSSELLNPPGLSEKFCGVLNLRGEMVAVVNTRKLYKMPQMEQKTQPKIMIFEHDGFKYGLVVDSVDSIIRFSDDVHIRLPDIIFKQTSGQLKEDVSNAVEVETGGSKKPFLILNVDAVSKRIGKAA